MRLVALTAQHPRLLQAHVFRKQILFRKRLEPERFEAGSGGSEIGRRDQHIRVTPDSMRRLVVEVVSNSRSLEEDSFDAALLEAV